MKKSKDYTIVALLIPFTIAVLSCLPACYGDKKKADKEIIEEVRDSRGFVSLVLCGRWGYIGY